ncbi:hypothetical protein FDF74_10285 [Clostridium niameyense]|uniref:Uncharacterized protein n=1 Tax=Clostridium niameyense TaxID=1622073 RepID=A0A6M0RDZ4_9CLOT|nr:3D domain-containing protein [Clostridium niameyense]NEZ47578.1 hypothetical protein [Clostridium niameyense]
MNRRVLSFIVMLTITLGVSSNALAVSNELEKTRAQKKEVQLKVENMDKEIDRVINKINENKQLMNKMNQQIKDTENKLNETQNNVKGKEELFGKRVRAMYIDGEYSYLHIILDSKNLSDFVTRVDTVSRIMKFDKNVIAKLKAEKEAVEKQKENLVNENNNLASLKKKNEDTLLAVNRKVSEEKRVLSKITEKENQLVASEEEKNRKAKEIAANNVKSVPKGEPLSRGGSQPISSSKVLVMEATAYSGDSITAGGHKPVRNPNGYSTIAVDPRVIPFGTKVYVEGYGYAIADDIGGRIKGNIIDVFLTSEAECNSWGRRNVKVHILG